MVQILGNSWWSTNCPWLLKLLILWILLILHVFFVKFLLFVYIILCFQNPNKCSISAQKMLPIELICHFIEFTHPSQWSILRSVCSTWNEIVLYSMLKKHPHEPETIWYLNHKNLLRHQTQPQMSPLSALSALSAVEFVFVADCLVPQHGFTFSIFAKKECYEIEITDYTGLKLTRFLTLRNENRIYDYSKSKFCWEYDQTVESLFIQFAPYRKHQFLFNLTNFQTSKVTFLRVAHRNGDISTFNIPVEKLHHLLTTSNNYFHLTDHFNDIFDGTEMVMLWLDHPCPFTYNIHTHTSSDKDVIQWVFHHSNNYNDGEVDWKTETVWMMFSNKTSVFRKKTLRQFMTPKCVPVFCPLERSEIIWCKVSTQNPIRICLYKIAKLQNYINKHED